MFVGFSMAIFYWLVASESDEFSLISILILTIVLLGIVFIQLLLILSLSFLSRTLFVNRTHDIITLLIFSVFVALNSYYFGFMTLESSFTVRVLSCVFVGILFSGSNWTVFFSRVSAIFVCSFMGISVVNYTYDVVSEVWFYANIGRGGSSEDFSERKNVYIFGFDALQSAEALRALYNIDTPPHYDYLSKNGFRIFDEAYSADSTTRLSFTRTLNFD